jgi:hypothetical protein
VRTYGVEHEVLVRRDSGRSRAAGTRESPYWGRAKILVELMSYEFARFQIAKTRPTFSLRRATEYGIRL